MQEAPEEFRDEFPRVYKRLPWEGFTLIKLKFRFQLHYPWEEKIRSPHISLRCAPGPHGRVLLVLTHFLRDRGVFSRFPAGNSEARGAAAALPGSRYSRARPRTGVWDRVEVL